MLSLKALKRGPPVLDPVKLVGDKEIDRQRPSMGPSIIREPYPYDLSDLVAPPPAVDLYVLPGELMPSCRRGEREKFTDYNPRE